MTIPSHQLQYSYNYSLEYVIITIKLQLQEDVNAGALSYFTDLTTLLE